MTSLTTEIELQVWKPKSPVDIEIYKTFVGESVVLGLRQAIIDKIIYIRKKYGLKLPDTLIAATALDENRILIADDDKDFNRVSELEYLNPKKIHQ